MTHSRPTIRELLDRAALAPRRDLGQNFVADPNTVWIGLEYFCSEGDSLWRMPDAELTELARKEMEQMGFIEKEDQLRLLGITHFW